MLQTELWRLSQNTHIIALAQAMIIIATKEGGVELSTAASPIVVLVHIVQAGIINK